MLYPRYNNIYPVRRVQTKMSEQNTNNMSLLDDYITEERADLTELSNKRGDCLTEHDIMAMPYIMQVRIPKIPYVKEYENVPIINNLDEFTEAYEETIETILESNNMFKTYMGPLWYSRNSIIGRQMEIIVNQPSNPADYCEASVSYGFDVSSTFSVDSVMRLVSQLFRIPVSGENTNVLIANRKNDAVIAIDDNFRRQIYYSILKRIDLLKKLVRLFTDDKKKTSFERLDISVRKYQHYAHPSGCVDYFGNVISRDDNNNKCGGG